MNFINLFLTFIGLVSIVLCVFFFMTKFVETWFDIQTCKLDIARLERQIKNLQCNRQ
jgi:hypothetical protein